MKIQEAVEHMTKMYLGWIVDSFTEDIPPKDEEEARETIIQHAEDLADSKRIRKRLFSVDLDYSQRYLQQFILESLLNEDELAATAELISQAVADYEKKIIQMAQQDDCFRYSDDRSIDILRTVLEVAVEDDRLSPREIALIDSLMNKLGLARREQYLLLAQLGYFPRAENKVHKHGDITAALKNLQKAGVVFYCNRHPDGSLFVIPEELEPGIKDAIGFELSDEAWKLLLNKLTKQQLKTILASNDVPVSGSKNELIERIMHLDTSPSETLDLFTSDELYKFLDGLQGAKVSGTKNERIDRIIDYFANLSIRDKPEKGDPRELYFEYFVELANRDRENLYANDIISKDVDIEHAFEKATRFLFEEGLDIELIDLEGNEHPDGCFSLGQKGLLMWDNKSKEDVYTFPTSHLKQFNRYIREVNDRVACFLIIVPEIHESVQTNMYELKKRSPDDTDVALISAEDLKWIANTWRDEMESKSFNPDIFNITGILDRAMLKVRLENFH